mgnify:FL=1
MVPSRLNHDTVLLIELPRLVEEISDYSVDQDGPDNQLPLPLFAKKAKRVGEIQSRNRTKGRLSTPNDYDWDKFEEQD